MLKSISLICLGFFTAGPEVDLTSATPDRSAPSLTVDRDSMLKMLENSKRHKARLPLPEPTAKDRENAKSGTLGLVNNGLMRRYYLPADWSTAAFPARSQQSGLVDYAFKTELFWIISRLNNCAYCLGHQEAKLATAGRTEAQIAALDGDWADADVATKAARTLAVLKTKSPDQPVPSEIWKDLSIRQFEREKRQLEGNKSMATDQFFCTRCFKRECTYYELQTRSADEPMTIFIQCVNCGKHWRQ